MGVFNGRDVYNPKILTAEITDAANNKYFVPIKHVLGDYFVTKINEQVYAFKLDGSRIKTTKQRAAFPFQTIDYDVTHYMPISGDIKLIELVEKINSLPKINNRLLGILKILGRTEKEPFTPHNLTLLIEDLSNSKDKYQKEVAEMINYFGRLNVNMIVTPLRRLTDFIEEDLKTTDAKFMGSIFAAAVEVDKEHKKVTNEPITAKKSLAILIMLPIMIGLVIAVVYFAYEAGTFDNMAGGFGSMFGGGATDEAMMKKYPDAISLRDAVDSGKEEYSTLPPNAKAMYDSTKGMRLVP
jgi:hypothetical protein